MLRAVEPWRQKVRTRWLELGDVAPGSCGPSRWVFGRRLLNGSNVRSWMKVDVAEKALDA